MKKTLVVVLVLLSVFNLMAAPEKENTGDEEYNSIPMLEKYFELPEDGAEVDSFWNGVKASLVTVSKDNALYSWFGHAAILIEYPFGTSMMFDYGRFSFGESFYVNFAMGRLWYRCCSSSGSYELAKMGTALRTVTKVELDISPAMKKALTDFLWLNSDEEHSVYLYHNYFDNCSTRLRDILNYITQGDFKKWAQSQEGLTYRKQISRILYSNHPVQWILDLLQGNEVDSPRTKWDEMFLPELLSKYLVEYGKLGSVVTYPVDNRAIDARPLNSPLPTNYYAFSIITGIVMVLLLALARVGNSRFLEKALLFVYDFVFGLIGSVLFFMMFFTQHDYCWYNECILFVNPLLLVSAFLTLSKRKGAVKARNFIHRFLAATLILDIVAKIIRPDVFIQDNINQIITLIPYMVFAVFCPLKVYGKQNEKI